MPEDKPDYSKRLKMLKEQVARDGGILTVCHHCGYPWICTSELELVSCPSCGGKTPRIKEKPQ